MIPDDITPVDDEVLAQLLAEDEALQAGMPFFGSSFIPPSVAVGDQTVAGTPPDLRECLRILEKVWPRTSPERLALPGPASPWKLGRFEVLQELGRGGFGIVYLAHDPKLGRRVALKVPRPEALLSDKLRRRFLHEARAAGLLDHPNIVPVFEAGEDGLLCYIATTYCEGPTLASWSRRRSEPVPMRLAARLVARMADAVQHAHDRGILHCDIKPSNVLLQQGADTLDPADLAPRLTDFGLARLTAGAEPGQDLSRSGVPVGSPPYMAPEQAAGRNREVGRGTDVYALGATLYELLTGRPPFRGETMTETLRLVIETDPVPPRTLRPGLSRDLETVCLKCLEKDPARRYASASELAADLERFLDGTAVVARPIPAWERGLRWTRRRPAATTAMVLAAVLVASLIGFASWSNAMLLVHNEELRREADRADESARFAERFVYVDRLRLAGHALELNQHERAQEILNDIHTATDAPDPREFSCALEAGPTPRWSCSARRCSRATTARSRPTAGPSSGTTRRRAAALLGPRRRAARRSSRRPWACCPARVSADGRLVAAVTGPANETGNFPGGWVWDGRTGESRRRTVHAGQGHCLESITPLVGDRLLVAARHDGGRTGLNPAGRRTRPRRALGRGTRRAGEEPRCSCISPDGAHRGGLHSRLQFRDTSAAEPACRPTDAEGNGPTTHPGLLGRRPKSCSASGAGPRSGTPSAAGGSPGSTWGKLPVAIGLAADSRRIAAHARDVGGLGLGAGPRRRPAGLRVPGRRPRGAARDPPRLLPDGRSCWPSPRSAFEPGRGPRFPCATPTPAAGSARSRPARSSRGPWPSCPAGRSCSFHGWDWPRVWRLAGGDGAAEESSHTDEAWAALTRPTARYSPPAATTRTRRTCGSGTPRPAAPSEPGGARRPRVSTLAFTTRPLAGDRGSEACRRARLSREVSTGRLVAIYLGYTDKVRAWRSRPTAAGSPPARTTRSSASGTCPPRRPAWRSRACRRRPRPWHSRPTTHARHGGKRRHRAGLGRRDGRSPPRVPGDREDRVGRLHDQRPDGRRSRRGRRDLAGMSQPACSR
ncbi:MAG: protein kinase [Isosphaeraceae bacterium]